MWKLAFRNPPKLPIFTGDMIKGANGKPLEVILVDADTSKELSHPPDELEIELVPLLGNFPPDCGDPDDFQRGIVEHLQGKYPLFAGNYRLTMLEGRATVNELMFTDESLVCDCMFRIGVRVIPGSYLSSRILEAITEAFMVRDYHSYELQYNQQYRWQLAFQSQPRLPIYIGRKITDVIGNPLEVILVDTKTGSPLVIAEKLDIQLFPVFGVFPLHDQKHWSADEFSDAVLNPQDEDAPLLCGDDVSVTMKDDGCVTVSDLRFKAASSYPVRIGACNMSVGYTGVSRIREAVTKPFVVQDIRNVMNTKRFPLRLGDEVWKLEDISRGGVLHESLTKNNVRNVQDFLRMLAVKPDKLRMIMNNEIDDDTWEDITSHARTCTVPIKKVYAYSGEHATIYVNTIFNLAKVEFSGVECPLDQLDEAQKRLVQGTIQEAYEHRHSLQEVQLTLKLAFKSPPRLPIHTGKRITDSTDNPLEIILVDSKTGSPWALPMELHIELVPLFGYFQPYNGKDDWSAEEFRTAIVKSRPGKGPLLKCFEDHLTMRDGRVTVNKLHFTDDSSWVHCHKFRIGACVVLGGSYSGAYRILEAMTEAFLVGDHKHYPPVLGDPVWRLDMIDREGEFHRTLTRWNIHSVQDFLRMLNIKPDLLRIILVGDDIEDGTWMRRTSPDDGNKFRNEMWLFAPDHARTCDPGGKVYAYCRGNGTIYVDSVFGRLFKIEIDGVECSQEQLLSDKVKKMLVRQLILEAYEHHHNLQEVGAAMEFRDHDTINIRWLLRGD